MQGLFRRSSCVSVLYQGLFSLSLVTCLTNNHNILVQSYRVLGLVPHLTMYVLLNTIVGPDPAGAPLPFRESLRVCYVALRSMNLILRQPKQSACRHSGKKVHVDTRESKTTKDTLQEQGLRCLQRICDAVSLESHTAESTLPVMQLRLSSTPSPR